MRESPLFRFAASLCLLALPLLSSCSPPVAHSPSVIASPTLVSTPTLDERPTDYAATPTVNITRQQYEEALARWHAQGVLEYEVEVDYLALSPIDGTWQLKVRVVEGKPELISYLRERVDIHYVTCGKSPNSLCEELQSRATVEGLFDWGVRDWLDALNSNSAHGEFGIVVAFHSTLGYVTSFELRTGCCGGKPATISVKSLKFVKSSAPGMPRTGNPGP